MLTPGRRTWLQRLVRPVPVAMIVVFAQDQTHVPRNEESPKSLARWATGRN